MPQTWLEQEGESVGFTYGFLSAPLMLGTPGNIE
jgi:hypothetical protein